MTDVALVLGEQRAWVEAVLHVRLQDVQPDARFEYATLARYYASPMGRIVLAKLDGDASGVLGVKVRPDGRAELKRFYVRPCARGVGLGKLLLVEAIEEALRLGCSSAYAETFPELMPAASHIFRQLGFRDTACEFQGVPGVIALQLNL
jgi:GNAT superfamily N-acetyltransferase